MPVALVRAISPRFADALVQTPGARPADVARAALQHRTYVHALHAAGLDIRWLTQATKLADGCFVEDSAVVCGDVALVTRAGAPSRRAEATSVSAALTDLGLTVHHMRAPATCDGGDVLRLGKHLFVGRSSRTNAPGVTALRRVFEPHGYQIIEVAVQDALHLKCHCTALGDDAVLTVPGFLDERVFDGIARVLHVPAGEEWAANVLCIGRSVLIGAGNPGVRARVLDAGLQPVPLEMSEIALADGSLTCLSLIVEG